MYCVNVCIQNIISNDTLSISANRDSQHVKMLIYPVSNSRSCDPNVYFTYIYPPKLRDPSIMYHVIQSCILLAANVASPYNYVPGLLTLLS